MRAGLYGLCIWAALPAFVDNPAQAESLACKDIWPALGRELATRVLNCERIGTMPHGDRKFAFYTVRGWTHPRMDEIVRGIGKGIRDSIATFDSIHRVPQIAFFLTNLPALEDAYGEAVEIDGNRTCAVAVNADRFEGPRRALFDTVEFVVAHEIAHCLQFEAYNAQAWVATRYAGWWSEGMAEYMANAVYPNFDMEHEWLESFDQYSPTRPLLEMKYEANIFFQYLENVGYDLDRIFGLAAHMATTDGREAQRAGAASIPGISDLFQNFAQAYLSGQIRDSSGAPLPVTPQPGEVHVFEDNQTRRMAAQPFVLERMEVEYRGNGNARVSHAALDGTGKIDFDEWPGSGNWTPPPEQIAVECGAPAKYKVAMTTTAADGQDYEIDMRAELPEDGHCGRTVTTAPGSSPVIQGSRCVELGARDPCLAGKWEVDHESLWQWMQLTFYRSGATGTTVEMLAGSAQFTFDPDGAGQLIMDGLTIPSESHDTSTPGIAVQVNNVFSGIERYSWSSSPDGALNRCPTSVNITMQSTLMLNGTPLPPMDPIDMSELREDAGAPPMWAGRYMCNGRVAYIEYLAEGMELAQRIKLNKLP